MSIQVLDPFFNWVTCYLIVELYKFCIVWIESFIRFINGNSFLPVCDLSPRSLAVLFCRAKVLNFNGILLNNTFYKKNIFRRLFCHQNNEKLQDCNKTDRVSYHRMKEQI